MTVLSIGTGYVDCSNLQLRVDLLSLDREGGARERKTIAVSEQCSCLGLFSLQSSVGADLCVGPSIGLAGGHRGPPHHRFMRFPLWYCSIRFKSFIRLP
jgi:hypothetical protein